MDGFVLANMFVAAINSMQRSAAINSMHGSYGKLEQHWRSILPQYVMFERCTLIGRR